MEYSFERLEVWKKSRALVKHVYDTTRSFPEEEKFGLTSQIRRAAVSISSNIAEGSTRRSPRDQARFYEISFGSLIEVLNQLVLASDLEYVSADSLRGLRERIDEIGRMLHSLRERART
ncbi:MAG: four helix bundle protein [Bacteroidota bacterium]